MKLPRAKSIWRVFWRLSCALILAAAVITGWYVTGPAGKPYAYATGDVPQRAWPRLSAQSVRDLPLKCSFIERDNDIISGEERPHRNHIYLAKHGGQYFVMFSFWYGAEGQPGQSVRYATSKDGVNWTKSQKLADPAPGHGVIARGFIERDGRLFAWYATHTGDTFFRNHMPKTERNIAILESEWMGEKEGWRFSREVIKTLVNNYAPRRFGKDLLMALRDSDRETYLALSRDDGLNWTVSSKMPLPKAPAPGQSGLYLADEPVSYDYSGENALVLLRNNNSFDGRLWAANLNKEAWSKPYPLPFASDTSKFFPLELGDGQTAMVGNFNPDVRRALLHIALSKDGRDFDRLYRLSLEGQYGRLRWRSPQYPHAIVDGDTLLLGVSYGKRALSVCKGPATAEGIEKKSGFELLPRIATGMCNRHHPAILRRIFGYAGCTEQFVWG